MFLRKHQCLPRETLRKLYLGDLPSVIIVIIVIIVMIVMIVIIVIIVIIV